MKKYIQILLITFAFGLFTLTGFSQDPPPPPSGGHGEPGNQPGGSSPIGSGMVILLGLAAAYGGKKMYELKNEDREE